MIIKLIDATKINKREILLWSVIVSITGHFIIISGAIVDDYFHKKMGTEQCMTVFVQTCICVHHQSQ